MFDTFIDKLAGTVPRQHRIWSYWLIFLLLFLPVGLITTVGYFLDEGGVSSELRATTESTVSITASLLETQLDYLVDVGKLIAGKTQVKTLVSQGQWDDAVALANAAVQTNPGLAIERVFLANKNGVLMADSPSLDGVRGRDFSFRDWYKGVSVAWESYVSEVYQRSAAPQYNIIAVATPVTNPFERGEVVGILVLQVKVDSFFEWLNNFRFSDDNDILYIVDHKGNIVAHPNFIPQGAIANLAEASAVKRILNSDSGSEVAFSDSSLSSRDKIIAYATVPSYGWGVVFEKMSAATSGFSSRSVPLTLYLLVIAYLLVLLYLAGKIIKYLSFLLRK